MESALEIKYIINMCQTVSDSSRNKAVFFFDFGGIFVTHFLVLGKHFNTRAVDIQRNLETFSPYFLHHISVTSVLIIFKTVLLLILRAFNRWLCAIHLFSKQICRKECFASDNYATACLNRAFFTFLWIVSLMYCRILTTKPGQSAVCSFDSS